MKQELSLLDFEPRGQDPQILWESEHNYTPEKYEQAEKMRAESDIFLENLSYTATKELKSLLAGNWLLEDLNGQCQEVYSFFGARGFFELGVNKEGNLYYRSQSSDSFVYIFENNYYIQPNWHYGIILKFVIMDGFGYLYVLDHDVWKLSEVHKAEKMHL